MAVTALFRRQSTSSACPSCGDPLESYVGGTLDVPGSAAAIAFGAINLICFLVLFILSCFVKSFITREGRKRGRFGLIWVTAFTLVAQIFILATDTAEITAYALTRGYLITYPFRAFFVLASDLTLIYTIFGFLYARIHALNGETRLARGVRITQIVMISVLPPLMAAWFVIYTITVARRITYFSLSSGVFLALYRATSGIEVTFDAIRLALAITFLGIGVKVFLDYRWSSNFSKIPTILVATTLPFYVVFALAQLILDAYFDFGNFGNSDILLNIPIILELLRGLLLVVVLAGLVAAGTRADWSIPSHALPQHHGYGPAGFQGDAPAGPYPSVDPTHFTRGGAPQQQHPQQQQPPYGGPVSRQHGASGPPTYGAPSEMSSTTAYGSGGVPPSVAGKTAEMYAAPATHELPPHQQAHADPFFRGGQRNAELPAGGAPQYRHPGSPGSSPPQGELPGALRTGSPLAPQEMAAPRRF